MLHKKNLVLKTSYLNIYYNRLLGKKGGTKSYHEKELFRGLTTQEAKQRIEKFGLNEITEKKKVSAIKILLQQFNDFIIWVLIGATIISGIMGDVADAITIFVIVVINGILGFVQEFKTEKSLDALKSLAAPTCKVLRDGNIKVINANELT